MFIVAPYHHRLARQDHEVEVSDLEKETWIVRELGSGTREATERIFRSLNIDPQNVMEFGSTQLIKESVESGLGITFLSDLAVRQEISRGLLKIVPVKDTPYKRKFSIILRTSFKTKALKVFIDLLKEHDTSLTTVMKRKES